MRIEIRDIVTKTVLVAFLLCLFWFSVSVIIPFLSLQFVLWFNLHPADGLSYLIARGDARKARDFGRRALLRDNTLQNSRDYKNHRFFYRLFSLYSKAKEKEKAIYYLKRAKELSYQFFDLSDYVAPIYLNLGLYYFNQKDYKRSLTMLKIASDLSPLVKAKGNSLYQSLMRSKVQPEPLFFAKFFEALGFKDEAKNLYETLSAQDSFNLEVLAALAEFYLSNGEKDKARQLLLQVVSKKSDCLNEIFMLNDTGYFEDEEQMEAYISSKGYDTVASPENYKASVGEYREHLWGLPSRGKVEIDLGQGNYRNYAIVARGSPCVNLWPVMIVTSNGKELTEFYVNCHSLRAYAFKTAIGIKEIEINYVNDFNIPPLEQDRNLYIGKLYGQK